MQTTLEFLLHNLFTNNKQGFLRLHIFIKKIIISETKRDTLIINDLTIHSEHMQAQVLSIRYLHLWMSMQECRTEKQAGTYGLSASKPVLMQEKK
ncbi:hypothetical protein SDC9_99833 [bioreactor metagenome]|uniref:Uncharacterized protein n=1 Tax=bioreactor metagenome TaxID=1076179 RepID=A0A645AIS4_9ZZZZ